MDTTVEIMLQHPHAWRVGWLSILCGLVSGAGLGLGFHRPDFWGGYGSFRRRLARLGHVAFIALGVLNLLFALSPWPEPGGPAARLAATSVLVGTFAMPLVCFLSAWREGFRHLFFVPVIALFTGVLTIVLGGMP